MFGFGSDEKAYRVDYCGEQSVYEGAKDSYKEGEAVILKYGLIATDTNYKFFLDDEPLPYEYKGGAFILKFIMPGHDVRIECRTTNSMAYTDPVTEDKC